MHFGLYLKKKGIVTADELVAALEAQLATMPRIGQLALEEGLISPRAIFDVLRAQRESPDVRFGDLAVEMGLVTRDELMRLLMIQADRKRPLAEVFVAERMLSQQRVDEEMIAFRRLQASKRAPSVMASKIVPMLRGQAAMRAGGVALAN
jgi:hypothetical protein